MAEPKVYNVLFLCTHNSARSVLAECFLNKLGKGKFIAFSAGSSPSGQLHPYVLEYLEDNGCSTAGLHSKSWDEFAKPDAPVMDFVFTVCDQAAGEICPIWPGQPIAAHWAVEDPSQYKDDPEKARKVVRDVALRLNRRLMIFTSLPLEKIDHLSLQHKVNEIGKSL